MRGLGERIRQRRLALGWRQQDLATALHTSAQSVSRWERETNDPDITQLPALARLLRMSVDALLGADADADGEPATIAMIGVRTARLQGATMGAAAFSAWCQRLLERTLRRVVSAGGRAIRPAGPGLLAQFPDPGAAHAAIDACATVHATALKIGVASGRIHAAPLLLPGLDLRSDVYGDPVTAALLLADWAGLRPSVAAGDHVIAWREPPATCCPRAARRDTVTVAPVRLGTVAWWSRPPGRSGHP